MLGKHLNVFLVITMCNQCQQLTTSLETDHLKWEKCLNKMGDPRPFKNKDREEEG